MNREDRIKLAIEKGYTYDELSGIVYGIKGNKINRKSSHGYITISLYNDKKRYTIYCHQFAYYIIYGKIVEQIDHIDNNRSNNKISNLREVTNQQNKFNKLNIKGYSLNKNNRFQSQIVLNKKNIYLGS